METSSWPFLDLLLFFWGVGLFWLLLFHDLFVISLWMKGRLDHFSELLSGFGGNVSVYYLSVPEDDVGGHPLDVVEGIRKVSGLLEERGVRSVLSMTRGAFTA